MKFFGLADCNNFFVSCERVFRPDLRDKPVVVLSNNDGCVISRSNEAKIIGIPMGIPMFKIKQDVEKYNITVFSSNYMLYGDLSGRVMSILSNFTPKLDQYSIDEAFLDLSNIGNGEQLAEYGRNVVATIEKWVGIPISFGIAPTRTLAKVASKYAKKYKGYKGVCIIDTEEKREKALKMFEIGDVFGIGRRLKERLKAINVNTAWDFIQLSPDFVKKQYSVSTLNTWRELRGESCITLDELPIKKSICTSRSFAGEGVRDRIKLEESVANFASECARKLREQQTCCSQITVFAYTSRFRTDVPQDYINSNETFEVPTNDTSELIQKAMSILRRNYRQGDFAYKKAGVIVWNIEPQNRIVGSLFDTRDRIKQAQLNRVVDQLNKQNGRGIVHIATMGNDGEYHLKREFYSKNYTTELKDIIVLKA